MLFLIENVGYAKNFDILGGTTFQGVPYDFRSIMHIRHNAFSNEIHCTSTVVPCNLTIPSSELGNSYIGTDFDFLHINLLYCQGMGVEICS